MAFVRAVKSIDLIVRWVEGWWRLQRSELMTDKLIQLLLMILIWGEFIVPEIWINAVAIKLIIIHITLINVQFRDIDIDA